MTKKFLYTVFAFVLVFAVACRKDSTVVDTTIEPTPPIVTVETSVLGLVLDLDGNALEGALLTLGNQQTNSDENGYFKLSGLTDSDNAIIKVEMAGYFDAWHAFQPFKEDIAQTKIRLTPRSNSSNISANDGGEVQFENAKVDFQAGSFVDESGNPYTGNVAVYATYLDPSDPGLHEIMPGNLTAFDTNNRLRLLETFGMINVELEGENGQKLQINKAATIELPIPASFLNRAPATIPLWFFDTEKARWVEEGSATLQGGKYIGLVEHFTFWNCDVPNDYIQLDGQAYITEQSASLTVCITNISTGDQRCTPTSANGGYFEGKVPSNTELLLEIYSECNDLVFSTNIGPFSDDVTVGPYQLNVSQAWAFVEGIVTDCDGNPVTNGYVLGFWANGQSQIFNLANDGSFSKYINTCDATEITLKAVDVNNHKSGDPIIFPLITNTDVGTLEACVNDIVEGVFINYGGNTYSMTGSTITSPLAGTASEITEFSIGDDQGGGNKILYRFTILDWSGLPNSTYAFSYSTTVFGTPNNIFEFDGGDIVLTESGQLPGDFVTFDITDVTVTLNGTTYPGGSIQIVGIIQ